MEIIMKKIVLSFALCVAAFQIAAMDETIQQPTTTLQETKVENRLGGGIFAVKQVASLTRDDIYGLEGCDDDKKHFFTPEFYRFSKSGKSFSMPIVSLPDEYGHQHFLSKCFLTETWKKCPEIYTASGGNWWDKEWGGRKDAQYTYVDERGLHESPHAKDDVQILIGCNNDRDAYVFLPFALSCTSQDTGEQDNLACSHADSFELESSYIPHHYILVCLVEKMRHMLDKYPPTQEEKIYGLCNQCSLQAFVVEHDPETKHLFFRTILGTIASYEHLQGPQRLYLKTMQKTPGEITVVCGNMDNSFLDVFQVNCMKPGVDKAKVKRSYDVNFRFVQKHTFDEM